VCRPWIAKVESNYESHSKALEDAKKALTDYHGRSGYRIEAATDFNSLSGVTGMSFPVSLRECPKCRSRMSLSREEKDPRGNIVGWYRCDRCSHELPTPHGYTSV
jgi:hypothetical protein